jgi:uncharacterized SAM-binding protein YcdF (DUF218 family)
VDITAGQTDVFEIIIAPLFISLLMLAIGEAVLFRHYRRFSRLERGGCLLLSVSTGTLLIASLPIVASALLYSLERQYREPTVPDLANADAVVVLSGGYVRGRDPSQDRLAENTYFRVLCGVDAFKASPAAWLIMSGRADEVRHTRMVDLMRGLAVEHGVPQEKILLEPFSRNTFEHPRELRKFDQIDETDTIAVATDAWHLPRAIGEFKRYFQRVTPIPCGIHSRPTVGLGALLPQVEALELTATMMHEYIGSVWYRIRHLGD